MDETAVAATTGVARVFDLNALKAFAADKRVRKMLFKTDQLWSEIACYEPGLERQRLRRLFRVRALVALERGAGVAVVR